MSRTMAWMPVPEEPRENSLSYELMTQLRKHIEELNEGLYAYVESTDLWTIGYLQALADMDVEDAEELLEAVRKHKKIRLRLVS